MGRVESASFSVEAEFHDFVEKYGDDFPPMVVVHTDADYGKFSYLWSGSEFSPCSTSGDELDLFAAHVVVADVLSLHSGCR